MTRKYDSVILFFNQQINTSHYVTSHVLFTKLQPAVPLFS